MKHIKAVVFDMDGLMLDSEPLALRALKRAGDRLGLGFTEEMLFGCIGLNAASSNAFLAEALGHEIPQGELSSAFLKEYDVELAQGGVPHKAGLIDLLEFLKGAGLRRAVATSTATALAERKLSSAGVRHYFEFVVGGDAVRHGKPAPDPYLQAASRLGLSAQACLALEDSDNGARSALAAGMTVIIVPDIKMPEEPVRAVAEACLESLDHVRDYLIPYFPRRTPC
jgi:HAD superfamily hydrolase (TIGR01509 family)